MARVTPKSSRDLVTAKKIRPTIARGDVYWVSLDPTIGSEIKKTRPAVIVSNNSCNRLGLRVVVLPITSNTATFHPGEAPVSVGKQNGRALGDQLRSVDKTRIGSKVGSLAASEMQRIDEALRITLAL
jgi:mRNA interferase MazF